MTTTQPIVGLVLADVVRQSAWPNHLALSLLIAKSGHSREQLFLSRWYK